MLKLVFAALFCVQAFARPSSDLPIESYVIGGTPAKEGQFPFAVSIRNIHSKGELVCGAALVSDKYVLTACHCVDKVPASWVGVGVGSVILNSQKIYKVEKIILHPAQNASKDFDENHTNMFFDLALLRLSSPVPLGGNVQIIPPFSTNDTLEGKRVTALGWGYTAQNGPISNKLLYLNQSVISNELCKKILDKPIVPGNICMKNEVNHGMFYHDSGSPLVHTTSEGKTYVVGIASWAVPGAKGTPDVFTRVSHHAKWIKETIK